MTHNSIYTLDSMNKQMRWNLSLVHTFSSKWRATYAQEARLILTCKHTLPIWLIKPQNIAHLSFCPAMHPMVPTTHLQALMVGFKVSLITPQYFSANMCCLRKFCVNIGPSGAIDLLLTIVIAYNNLSFDHYFQSIEPLCPTVLLRVFKHVEL